MFLQYLFNLMVAHAITDVWMQDCKISSMVKAKNPYEIFSNETEGHWPYWLFSHGLINGAGAYIATRNIYVGIFETIAHMVIDIGKMAEIYDVHVDQTLHFISKIGWAYVACATSMG